MASGGVPPASGANAVPFQSRDEMRKARELEEARKSGLAPAEKDEDGRDINPHIPQYIAKAPWYLSQDQPSLKHQRFKEGSKGSLAAWYQRGLAAEKPTKFRPGACTNCGAMTHTAKDCTDRPRKLGAKWTKSNMMPDEIVVQNSDIDLDWDGKRDRWGGFDPDSYSSVTRDYELAELERKRQKQQELEALLKDAEGRRKKKRLRKKLSKLKNNNDGEEGSAPAAELDEDGDSDAEGGDSDSDNESEGEGDAKIREFDRMNAVVSSKDERTRTTTRNLRIREDTAKYLYNLDLDSAFYDPKTRSMRDDPLKNMTGGGNELNMFVGDNKARHTGDAVGVAKMEIFAWEAYKHGSNMHFQSMPTQLEHVYKQHLEKKEKLTDKKRDHLLAKYGGENHLKAPKELLHSQTEEYVEYFQDGTVKQHQDRVLAVSKYLEDVYIGNHTAVWGSWYDVETAEWGFGCCRSKSKLSDCKSAAAPQSAAAMSSAAAAAGVVSSS